MHNEPDGCNFSPLGEYVLTWRAPLQDYSSIRCHATVVSARVLFGSRQRGTDPQNYNNDPQEPASAISSFMISRL